MKMEIHKTRLAALSAPVKAKRCMALTPGSRLKWKAARESNSDPGFRKTVCLSVAPAAHWCPCRDSNPGLPLRRRPLSPVELHGRGRGMRNRTSISSFVAKYPDPLDDAPILAGDGRFELPFHV
jgi:hypothetical protein